MSLKSKKPSNKQKSQSKAVNVSSAKKTSLLIKILAVLVIVFIATVIGAYILDKTTTNKLKAKAGSVNVKQIWEAPDGDGDGRTMRIVACMRGNKIVIIFGKDTEYTLWSGVASAGNSVEFDRNQSWWGGEVQAREIDSATSVAVGLYRPSDGKYMFLDTVYRVGVPNCNG